MTTSAVGRQLARAAFALALVVGIGLIWLRTGAGWASDDASRNRQSDAVLVVNADRATLLTNMRRDPTEVRWYRGTSAKCCAFCAMAASRGAVYRSQDTADFKPHNNCKCFPVPLWPGDAHELPSYYEDFTSEYADARRAAIAAGERPTAKAILAHWRAATSRA